MVSLKRTLQTQGFFLLKVLSNYETMLTTISKTITTANALIPDLMEWGLSSWLNMDI